MTIKQCKTCQKYIQFGVNPNKKDEHCWLATDYFFMKPKICPHYLNGEPNTAYKEFFARREAERKLSEVTNNLANEVKKNGLLNEELNQLRIENMRLKKKGGD